MSKQEESKDLDETSVESEDNTEVEEVEEELEEEVSEVSKLTETIQKLSEALEEEKTNFLKAHADLENTKKRITNDFNQRDKYKVQSFALGILPVIDNMEKIISDETITDEHVKEALEMIYRQLMSSLEAEGVVEIKALDEKFDPNIHHAVMLESVEGKEADIVVEVLQKGYMIKDRVLRASMVKVTQ